MKFKFILFVFLLVSCVKESTSSNVEQEGITGKDLNGKVKTCKPMPAGTMCTQMFGPSDEFANKCRAAGLKAIQCACHDWICLGDLNVK